MNYIPNDVATVGMGLAASMGQFLLCAGAKGKRYALPHARIMMHQPSGGMGGSASDIKIQAEQSLHIKKVLLELIAEHTGQTARAGRGRRRPRPLVHRRAGRRTTASSTRSSPAPAQVADEGRPARTQVTDDMITRPRPALTCPTHELLHPAVGGAHVVRLPPHRPLRQAVRGPHHLPRHPDQRRHRQRRDGPAAVPGVDGPRPATSRSTSTARRLVHRADRDLRHDAVHQARRADRVPGPGGLGRRDPARGRHPGQAARAAEQPDPDPPALHRGHLRPDLRHRDPGQRDPADARAAREDDRRAHRQDDRGGQPRHRARQDPHRRGRPSSTA